VIGSAISSSYWLSQEGLNPSSSPSLITVALRHSSGYIGSDSPLSGPALQPRRTLNLNPLHLVVMDRPSLNLSGRDTDRAKLDTVNSFVEELQLYANNLEDRVRAGEIALADQEIEVENLREEVNSLQRKALDIEMVFKGREELLLSQVSAASISRGATPLESSAILAATHIKPPPMRRYSGSKPEEFEAFQDAVMTTIFRMSHAYSDENKCMNLVSDHLDAPASGWLTSLRRKKLDSLNLTSTSIESASIHAFDTVQELLSALQTRFDLAFPMAHYYDLFRSLTQGSLSVADFTNKFEDLSSRLPKTKINDSVLKLDYRSKLSPALRTKMLNFGEASTLGKNKSLLPRQKSCFRKNTNFATSVTIVSEIPVQRLSRRVFILQRSTLPAIITRKAPNEPNFGLPFGA